MADCRQFLSENRLKRCQIFGLFGFKTEFEQNFSFPHIPIHSVLLSCSNRLQTTELASVLATITSDTTIPLLMEITTGQLTIMFLSLSLSLSFLPRLRCRKMSVCLSVRVSHADILSKQLNISSNFFYRASAY